jgi:two-component system alkaline phosphatase synthesis response regulator PhoP
MLPQEDGLTVLSKLRAEPATAGIPVILLTAKSTEYDKIIGLDGGADDYVTKPFGVMELMARIRALLRRTAERGQAQAQPGQEGESVLQMDRLYVNIAEHVAKADGKEVSLTMKEFDLLCMLLRSRGLVLSRDAILNEVWGYTFSGETRTVDVHIRTLRAKLGRPATR